MWELFKSLFYVTYFVSFEFEGSIQGIIVRVSKINTQMDFNVVEELIQEEFEFDMVEMSLLNILNVSRL